MARHDRKWTLSLKHSISVLSHEKHTHSLKRWKPSKNAEWQGRQLVIVQSKRPVSRRNRELGRQLWGILSKTNKKRTNIYIHTHKYACWYVWLCAEREWIRVRQPAVRYTEKNKQRKNKYIHTQTRKHACWYVWLYEERERIRVRQTAVRYTQKSEQTNQHTCVSVSVCVWGARANQRHTRHHRSSSVCEWSLHACARVWAGTISLISLFCVCLSAGAHRDTNTHTHTHTSKTKDTNTHTHTHKQN